MIILFISFLIIATIAVVSNLDHKSNALTLSVGGLILFILASIRHESMGQDTMSYIIDFLSLKTVTDPKEQFEQGFYYFKLFVSSFTDNPAIYLMLNSLVFLSSVIIFVL